MEIRHPRALDGDPPFVAIDVGGKHVDPNDDDGTYTLPDGSESWLDAFAEANDCTAGDLLVDDSADTDACQEVKGDGEVCGRDRPCPYHD